MEIALEKNPSDLEKSRPSLDRGRSSQEKERSSQDRDHRDSSTFSPISRKSHRRAPSRSSRRSDHYAGNSATSHNPHLADFPELPSFGDPMHLHPDLNYSFSRKKTPSKSPSRHSHHSGTSRSKEHRKSDAGSVNSGSFNWDEDETYDSEDSKPWCCRCPDWWFVLSPFMQTFIKAFIGFAIFALPAALIAGLVDDNDPSSNTTYSKFIAIDWFAWIAWMWVIFCTTSFLVERSPRFILRVFKYFRSQYVEQVRVALEYFIAVRSYFKAVATTGWMWGSFAFTSLVWPSSDYRPLDADSSYSYSPSYYGAIYNILVCVFSATAIVFIEKVLLHYIAIQFHRVAYEDRIAESQKGIKVLDRLSTAFRRHSNATPSAYNAFARFGGRGREGSLPLSKTSSLPLPTSASVLHTNSAPLHGAAQSVMEAPGNFISSLNKKLQYIAMARKDQTGENTPTQGVNGSREAKKLAKKLFAALKMPNRRHVYPQDFLPYFPTEEEAAEAFALFDKDSNGDISRREMKDAVAIMYKDRRDLSTSLRDMSQAIGKLDNLFMIIGLIILIVIIVTQFNGNATKALTPLWTFIVAASFIFGQSAKNAFDSIIFMFVTHPYDAGDVIYLETDIYTITELGLLTTVMTRVDGQLTYAPNIVLSQKLIRNIRRSNNMCEVIEIQLDFSTPSWKIEELLTRMNHFLETEMSRDFVPTTSLNISDLENTNRIKASFWIEHKSNWQDGGRRWERRNKFVLKAKQVITDLGIQYSLPMQPIDIHGWDPDYWPAARRGDFPPSRAGGGSGAVADGEETRWNSGTLSNSNSTFTARQPSLSTRPHAPGSPPPPSTTGELDHGGTSDFNALRPSASLGRSTSVHLPHNSHFTDGSEAGPRLRVTAPSRSGSGSVTSDDESTDDERQNPISGDC
ncbi:MAG: hypothetical protein DHS80DRAFT_16543 [Piptocephalis tieghemiana]|nr:MAG: hypothetical protein DHS80DRAFT_16543 [Piptocephalis tieghemiana]